MSKCEIHNSYEIGGEKGIYYTAKTDFENENQKRQSLPNH